MKEANEWRVGLHIHFVDFEKVWELPWTRRVEEAETLRTGCRRPVVLFRG